jgi:hypothetical protein
MEEQPRPKVGTKTTSFNVSQWLSDKVDWLASPPFLPQDTRQHLYNSRRELLLAGRSLIDRSLERMEERERRRQTRQTTKIEVE